MGLQHAAFTDTNAQSLITFPKFIVKIIVIKFAKLAESKVGVGMIHIMNFL